MIEVFQKMFIQRKSYALYLTVFALLVAVWSPNLRAQSITLLKRFTTLNGTIDFLPGAWVNVWENGQSQYYKYADGQFVRSPELPKLLRKWVSFDWGNVDVLDQVAIQGYDQSINRFLPKGRKVKKVIEFSLHPQGSKDLVLVCFTLQSTDPDAFRGDTDIYMTALLETEGTSGSAYKRLWTRKMETDASYGEFTVQEVPAVGRFLVLYWWQGAGSGTNQGLDVYRITD